MLLIRLWAHKTCPTNETTCIWTPLTKVWTFGQSELNTAPTAVKNPPHMRATNDLEALKWKVASYPNDAMCEAGDTCSKPSFLVRMLLVFGDVKIGMFIGGGEEDRVVLWGSIVMVLLW